MNRDRGLKSIKEARQDRVSRKFGRPTGTAAIVVVVGLLLVLLGNYLWTERKLDAKREAVLSQQRAALATLGAEWFPLRDRIEGIVMANANDYLGDQTATEATTWDFRAIPGIYLRLRTADAQNVKDLRTAGGESRRDGFTACLLRTQSAEDMDAGQSEDRPWNLRQAYMSTRVLTDEWTHEVKTAGDEMRVRVFEEQYDKAKREEIPVAVDIVKRAQFFLLVLDEDTAEARADQDGGPLTLQALELYSHASRVILFNLNTNKLEMRLRRTPQTKFYLAGENRALPQESRDAMVRQVNNCGLATDVKRALKMK